MVNCTDFLAVFVRSTGGLTPGTIPVFRCLSLQCYYDGRCDMISECTRWAWLPVWLWAEADRESTMVVSDRDCHGWHVFMGFKGVH